MTTAQTSMIDALAHFAVNVQTSGSRDEADLVAKAKLHFMDAIGVALASRTMDDHYAEKLIPAVEGLGLPPECTVIGFPQRTGPAWAAFVNGSLIHGCDFDDSHLHRILHSESFAVPVNLALAESLGLTGRQAIDGWLVAAEVAIRLASGLNEPEGGDTSGSLNDLGFHTTSVFGIFGAAASAARQLGLSADEVATAISLAVSFASGTSEGWGEESGRHKCVQPGWAAMSGIQAAQMAQAGYDCPHTTLTGKRGLYGSHGWRDGWSPDPVTEELGESWRCLEIIFKLWPAGTKSQGPIACTQDLVFEHDIKPSEVESVEVVVPHHFASQFRPGKYESMFRPTSGYAVHSSWPCNVGRMILDREVKLSHLTLEEAQNKAMLEIADKVSISLGPAGGLQTENSVTIHTTRGTFKRTRTELPGDPSVVDVEDVRRKFRQNAGLVLPEADVAALEDRIGRLEEISDITEITGLLAPKP